MSGITSVATLGALGASAAEDEPERDYYELRRYHIANEDQKVALGDFMGDAAIPALNRLGIRPVGVFEPAQDLSPIYVLLRHTSMESVATLTQRLLADAEFTAKGASFLDTPVSDRAYWHIESMLMVAFAGMPHLEMPTTAEGRVFQLRTYKSPSVKTGQKKIEMFNTAELDIFRKVGMTAVFFGETLIGDDMPNLTYMLGFDGALEQEAAWQRFFKDPDWIELRAKPEYSDKAILCGITDNILKPAACSQI